MIQFIQLNGCLLCLVLGILFFCTCREKENNYEVNLIKLLLGSIFMVLSFGFLSGFVDRHWHGYSVNDRYLTTNAVYELVSSSVLDGKNITILKEPDGTPRLFSLESDDLKTVEGKKFLKAIKDGEKTKLVSLDP